MNKTSISCSFKTEHTERFSFDYAELYSWDSLKTMTITYYDNETNEKIHDFVVKKDKNNYVYVWDKVTKKRYYDSSGRKYKVLDNCLVVKEEE